MSRQFVISTSTKRVSLSAYISLLLVATAVIPLLVTVSSLEIFLRPALISQIGTDMTRDAQTHIQLIDTYLAERLNDIKTLSESGTIKNVLAGNQNSRRLASDTLFTTLHRDVSSYSSLSLLNPQGNAVVLSYPSLPLLHGKYLMQPDILQHVQTSSNVSISDVFYDPLANNPSVDFYTRVVDNNLRLLGIVRASLSLHRLWQPVDSTPQTQGAQSYAFVLDQHGIRIAYTNPDHSGFTHPKYLFKAVGSITADFQQRIKDENLYGNNSNTVSSIADNTLASMQNSTASILQFDPTGQGQTFEAAKYSSTIAPWTYFILKPLSVVTGLANQQLLGSFLTVSITILLALIGGIQLGRNITASIIRSVTALRKNSLSLKTLASEEQVVASEQSWMVEASQVAQQSIKYYTYATKAATQQLSSLSAELTQNKLTKEKLSKSLNEIAETAKYIDRAIKHQENANEKLAAALRVTTQAAEQLSSGATLTDNTATELEYIVQQLMAVVGAKDTGGNSDTSIQANWNK